MGCCEGNCSCGKGNASTVQEPTSLLLMSAGGRIISTQEWMKGLASLTVNEEVNELRFKNNRKAFYRNNRGLKIHQDDRMVVEVEGGYDLGTITLTGERAEKQFNLIYPGKAKSTLRKINRKATELDLEKWLISKRREREVLLKSRQLVVDMKLDMSIGDVEFQGDGKKVTVYYTADGMVDYQELVRKYTESFKVKIEMKRPVLNA